VDILDIDHVANQRTSGMDFMGALPRATWVQHELVCGCGGHIMLCPDNSAGGVLAVSRLVYGRELAMSPMECQINAQSTPDAVDLSQIVTLVSHKYVKALRHGIYEHDYCAKAISDWVRSRLAAQ